MDNEHLVNALREYSTDSEQAAETLLKVCGPVVFKIVRRRLGRRSPRFDSTDIAQAVWASFFGDRIDMAQFATPKDLINYLAAMASNKVRKAQRDNFDLQKRSANKEVSIDVCSPGVATSNYPTPSQVAIADETWQRLLAETPQSQQKVLYLRLEGLTQEQIAATLGITSRTVRRLMDRLKQRIDL